MYTDPNTVTAMISDHGLYTCHNGIQEKQVHSTQTWHQVCKDMRLGSVHPVQFANTGKLVWLCHSTLLNFKVQAQLPYLPVPALQAKHGL